MSAVMILLLFAGAQKIIAPTDTSGALRAAGLPSGSVLVRFLGVFEVSVAIGFLVWGGWIPAALAALLYAGFAWFVINALVRKLPISSCGCLGSTETPPTMVHVIMNFLAVTVLVVGVIMPVGPLGGLLGAGWRTAVPYLLFVGVVVYMLYALLTVLPLVSKKSQDALPTPVALARRSGG